MKILSIESSAKAAGVAIVQDDILLGEMYTNTGLTHSVTLMPMCESLLKQTNLKLSDIDGFAVSVGPGSFTGVRIAIATIKGLMLTGEAKCYPVSTLMALAYNVKSFCGTICAVMDARCNQVYNALFESDGQNLSRICDDRAISIDDLKKEIKNIKKNVIFVGDGAILCYNFLGDFSNVGIAPPNLRYQRASSVAFCIGDECAADELDATYLRLPQAERERMEKENKQ